MVYFVKEVAMKKAAITVIIIIIGATILSMAIVSRVITNGEPGAGRHPYVGLTVFEDAEGPLWWCTGTLIAPDVIPTAGHCTYDDTANRDMVAARVWFEDHPL